MSEYLDYTLTNLLLFSPETFFRQFELYHSAVFPVQLVLPFLFIGLLFCYKKAPNYFVSVTLVLIAASCVLCAFAYHLQFYKSINWVAHYFAKLFILQGVLFTFAAYKQWREPIILNVSVRRVIGGLLIFYSIVAFPFIDLLLRENWMQIQLVAVTPDPTMILALGILLCFKISYAWLMAILPVIWLIISGLIFYTMNVYEGVMLIVISVIFLIVSVGYRTRKKLS